MFRKVFEERFRNDANDITCVSYHNQIKVLKMFSSSFEDGFKKDPTAIGYIMIAVNQIKVLKMFRKVFEEKFTKDQSFILKIYYENNNQAKKLFPNIDFSPFKNN